MNINATFEKLHTMHLHGFAQAYREVTENIPEKDFSLDELIAHLIEAEYQDRYNKKLKRLIRQARFKQQASFEQINFHQPRGMDKTMLLRLQQGDWIKKSRDLIITGPTGVGKSFIACALGFQACSQELKTMYYTANNLLDRMTFAKADGSYFKFMDKLARANLLIIDDFGLRQIDHKQCNMLLDLVDERHGSSSTIIASQLPVKAWFDCFKEPTVGDAILDRITHGSYRIELQGESMRKFRK